MEPRVWAAYLAAGESRRFGSPKLKALLRGIPLWRWSWGTLRELRHRHGLHLLAVVGEEANDLPLDADQVLFNREPHEGMASSLRLAVEAAARERARALLIVLADMPLITVATLERILRAWQPGRIVLARGSFGVSPPAFFDAAFFPDLKGLKGDRGARALARRHENALILVEVDDQELWDVDTPQDLERAALILGEGGGAGSLGRDGGPFR